MCGITGIVYFDSRVPAERDIRLMTDVIHHRGPDDIGFYTSEGVGMGFRRLSIIDIAEGHQPLTNEDGTVWITFNGEIYNYKMLRELLSSRGHQFKTHSDTEVIVHLYEEFGADCVNHLRGMYSFVIWDEKKRTLFGARDHFGIKPFYYRTDDERFLYGSEIKSILAADGVSRRLNNESLLQYLTLQYVPEPDTMFAGIHKLPPGHTILVERGGKVTIRPYWQPEFAPEQRPIGDYIEQIREKLKDSVEHHLVSDVQRGCFLSSGIDSTAIASLMRQFEPIKTFSVGFEGANNETTIAGQTAKAIGTDHYAKIITEADYFDSIRRAVWHQDEPVADPSAIALYHVAELARQHVTVVLSGEGADELFGGYRIYREPRALRPISGLPRPLQLLLRRAALLLPSGLPGRGYVLRGTTPLEQRFVGNARLFSDDMKAELLQLAGGRLPDYRTALDIAAGFYTKTKHLDPVSRMQHIDLNMWMPGDILMKADKMTMAHSLELRVPFLDKELFELARKIPADYRIAGGTTKYVFRKAMEGIIPDFILQRPKLGFPVPMRDWLKGKRGDEVWEWIRSSGIDGIIRMDHVKRMLDRHRAGQGDYARMIWAVYMFGEWHRTFMSDQPQIGSVRSVV